MIVDILTPPARNAYAPEAAEQAKSYIEAFAAAGLDLRPRPWPEAGDRPATALLAWGYHTALDEWLALLDRWPAKIPLFNAAALMRWNTRKTYLAELERAGVPTVPTWFGDADQGSVSTAFDRFGCDELVVKPQVSAGSYLTHRLTRADAAPALPAAMVQPFLPAIQTEGEYSLFYIGGTFSHAIRKVAQGSDFRIQPQFGGVNTPWQPDDEAVAVAQAAFAAAPGEPLYVRIDLIRRLDGKLALIELEAIEPDLYIHHGDCVPQLLAAAVTRALADHAS
ncbi:transporter [Sphingomonas sp. ID1715]|uniref:ATP-grasp domain-containing protein n=1 Tax=Sphingomonas sp. ID1715 TaxID=1656898 RepID=UPI0014895A8C|nr:transporter [Sphingomonas sp. ID1715]NNM77344.1 transporter [Sphingomonas sp. ID1715]